MKKHLGLILAVILFIGAMIFVAVKFLSKSKPGIYSSGSGAAAWAAIDQLRSQVGKG